MAKGSIAKNQVENIIREAFGKNFIGVIDKKIYVNADDGNGEMVNIAITLTCPKVQINAGNLIGDGNLNFDNMPDAPTEGTEFKPAEITEEETEDIHQHFRL